MPDQTAGKVEKANSDDGMPRVAVSLAKGRERQEQATPSSAIEVVAYH